MVNRDILDVVIIGAGLSGIGAAVNLVKKFPDKEIAILESRAAMGGTWDLFRYPGIRSDSDMLTLGYDFKPWKRNKIIADGESIRDYIREAAQENGVDQKVRYHHQVISMDWSSITARWTLVIKRLDTDQTFELESRFVLGCAGYYRYDAGYTPQFPDAEKFTGTVIHPQHWPEDTDYKGMRIIVIGSGATAVTLIPSLAEKADHVTMLQRSPSYMISLPENDPISSVLRTFLPEKAVYSLGRIRNVLFQILFYQISRRFPDATRKFLLSQVRSNVGDHVDMRHFSPDYKPWDQRLCAVPNGDFFKTLRDGKASIITDHIERFTSDGITLKSGKQLDADVIVTATGLSIQILGGIRISLDGQDVDVSKKLFHKASMLEDIPNLITVFGYTNSSWTLKADLISRYTCRVLKHMDRHDYSICVPRNYNKNLRPEPFLDLTSGYVQRALNELPQQAQRNPWRVYQNYLHDLHLLKFRKVNDSGLVFTRPSGHGYGHPEGEESGWLHSPPKLSSPVS